ncbi:MAG: hypothetical protein OEY89_12170 [Gammaproteobacteria bacterium]|nr:hypothetical protein [Gammaproteobacteria bacterium]
MAKRVTTEEFVNRAKAVHGDRYDYSLAEYKGIHKNVIIICPEHGAFPQTPANHYAAKGCPDCGGSKPHTTESFIEAARKKHGDKYDYSQVDYHSNKVEVTIICPEHGPFPQIPKAHLKEHGCRKCAGNLKHTNESFIEKAQSIHGDRYDYSQVDYMDAFTKVLIICPEHGPFKQSPDAHFAGKGCKKCGWIAASDAKRYTTELFIEKAKAIHGNRYDYSLVDYIASAEKVTIICEIHGPFEQAPNEHLIGSGCNKCGIDSRAEARRKTTEEFIANAREVHGDRYDYTLVEYLSAMEKVTIICPEHGPFPQTPNGHIGGKGCYECGVIASGDAKRSNAEEFIAKARMIHGEKYDYSLVEYVRSDTKVKIVCPEHGVFPQAPNDHIHQKSGCPDCAETGFNPNKPGLLYYLAISTDDGDMLYKIGITNLSVEERFRGSDLARIRVVKIWRFDIGSVAATRESEILNQFADDRYYGPRILIGAGNTELFTHDILRLDYGDYAPDQSAVDEDAVLISRLRQTRFDF